MKVVVAKWQDSTTFSHWATADEVDKSSLKICYAAGFLITENDKQVTIALLASDDKDAFSDWINIPAINILELSVVEVVDWEKKKKDE